LPRGGEKKRKNDTAHGLDPPAGTIAPPAKERQHGVASATKIKAEKFPAPPASRLHYVIGVCNCSVSVTFVSAPLDNALADKAILNFGFAINGKNSQGHNSY